jgi:hypothetical protein
MPSNIGGRHRLGGSQRVHNRLSPYQATAVLSMRSSTNLSPGPVYCTSLDATDVAPLHSDQRRHAESFLAAPNSRAIPIPQ